MTIPFAAPERFFASDNNASVHPAVLECLAAVNRGHALAYGDDEVSHRASRVLDDLFGRPVSSYFVWNGTGANVLALASILRPAGAVVCTSCAHINVDETGAPERFLGAKLIDLDHQGGKLLPEVLRSVQGDIGVVHHAQPSVLSLTQSTEWGSVYSVDEIGELCETAHSMGMLVHLDGARISNAVAAAGGGIEALRAMTVEAGVDVVSLGGTKNGLMYGEAVVFLRPNAASFAPFLRKQATQLPSKVRYIAAQFEVLFGSDLWIENALHANSRAKELFEAVSAISELVVDPPEVNSLYPILPVSLREALREWSFFYDWDASRNQVRWMTSWDTTTEDIEVFVAGLRYVLNSTG